MSKMKITDDNKVYGQTIGIKYYVEKRLKARPYFVDGKRLDSYPLYIQITAKQQVAQRRSQTGLYVVPELLDQFLTENSEAIAVETDELRSHILSHKPFESAKFVLKHALKEFNAFHADIRNLIGDLLFDDYREAYEADLFGRMCKEELFKKQVQISLGEKVFGEESENELRRRVQDIFWRQESWRMPSTAVVDDVYANAVLENKEVTTLYNKYGVHFWSINYYLAPFINSKTNFMSLLYFVSSDLKKNFVELWGEDIYNSVFQAFTLLRAEKKELNEFMSSLSL